jgi:anthranilate synthase/aminodeoxychorismate synthase-like glutamine amidotransferase
MVPSSRPSVLLLDNYDSFTWNLAQYLEVLGAGVRVVPNDEISLDEVAQGGFDAIVVSPGPGRPEDAGISVDLVRRYAGRIPILGVCLGHQAIALAHGGRIGPAPTLVHGKTSPIHHDGRTIFAGLPTPFDATRYHSLVIEGALPEVLEVSARTDDGAVMGVRHRCHVVEGVQFHPESILTVHGMALLRNFLERSALPRPA